MKTIILGALVAITIGLFSPSAVLAAPMSTAPLAQSANDSGNVLQVQYHHWRGGHRWHRGPVCRSVRVCGRYHRCTWVRRCR